MRQRPWCLAMRRIVIQSIVAACGAEPSGERVPQEAAINPAGVQSPILSFKRSVSMTG
jgi:hypothetical protein